MKFFKNFRDSRNTLTVAAVEFICRRSSGIRIETANSESLLKEV